jgi:hypothetical protein
MSIIIQIYSVEPSAPHPIFPFHILSSFSSSSFAATLPSHHSAFLRLHLEPGRWGTLVRDSRRGLSGKGAVDLIILTYFDKVLTELSALLLNEI